MAKTAHKDYICKVIGLRIEMYRKQRKWSQALLAEKVGVSRTSIVNMEAGRQMPTLDRFIQIASELDVAPARLLKGIE